eukprot:3170873-Rhodomonas_salina.3
MGFASYPLATSLQVHKKLQLSHALAMSVIANRCPMYDVQEEAHTWNKLKKHRPNLVLPASDPRTIRVWSV